ncbi:MAG: hypothetical protein ACN6PI_02310, partial [Sphingobacterium siyangense]
LSLPPVRASAQDTGKGKGAQESTKVVREWQCSPIPATESQAQQTDGDRAGRWQPNGQRTTTRQQKYPAA